MLRIALKALIILFLCFAIGRYLVYLKTGRFWMPSFSSSDIKAPELSLPQFGKPSYTDFSTSNTPKSKTYKWRENGQWVYGDTPPEHVNAIRIDLNEQDKR